MHQPGCACIKCGQGLRVCSGAVAQHDAYPFLLEVMDRLQGFRFFRSKRHYPQRVLRNRNQIIKFREIQFAKQFLRMCPFVLRRKVRAFQIAAQDLRTGATDMTASGNAP